MAIVGIAFAIRPPSASAQARRSQAVPRLIIDQLMRDTVWAERRPASRDSMVANLVAVPLDLNGDGSPELEVHGINSVCGANNCLTWIYRHEGTRYVRLLFAGTIQDVEPQSSRTHGYRDVITARHRSAWDSDLTLYKFDGREYRRTRCFLRTYRYVDAHGRAHELTRPRLTLAACQAHE